MNYEDMQPTTHQKMAKPIPTTKPTRKPENNTKHHRSDENGLKLTGPMDVVGLGWMDTEGNTGDSLRPEQKEILDGLVRRFFVDSDRFLLVEAPTGVGKTRIALEFVREFRRRRSRCRVLVVVLRRGLAYYPWKKEIDK
jgi:superfamily II DNA or RNA helicase